LELVSPRNGPEKVFSPPIEAGLAFKGLFHTTLHISFQSNDRSFSLAGLLILLHALSKLYHLLLSSIRRGNTSSYSCVADAYGVAPRDSRDGSGRSSSVDPLRCHPSFLFLTGGVDNNRL
jgi:hypothetical protein